MIYNNYDIIYFDGECILCNYFFKKILKWDKDRVFHFATLQSEKSQAYLSQFSSYTDDIDSVIYTSNGNIYFQDQAVFEIAKKLPFPYSLVKYGRFFPSSFTHWTYKLIAKRRYSIWGKQECMLPSADVKSRFLFL